MDARPAAPIAEDRARKEAQLLMDLFDACEPDQKDLIIDAANPQDAWNVLRLNFENQSSANPTRLWWEFEKCHQLPNESMREYINKVRKCVRELRAAGETVPTVRLIERLTMGMDRKYDVLKSNLNIRSNLTEVDCTTAMYAEENRY